MEFVAEAPIEAPRGSELVRSAVETARPMTGLVVLGLAAGVGSASAGSALWGALFPAAVVVAPVLLTAPALLVLHLFCRMDATEPTNRPPSRGRACRR